MQTEGIRKAALSLIIVLATSLTFGRPLTAQRVIANLPRLTESGENPVSFMRPHYSVFTPDPYTGVAATPGAPPTSAFNPTQIRHAYGFDLVSNQGAGQTIGIVDAYDDPNAEADLGVFDKQYGLATCASSNGCFRKVYSSGKAPASNANWAMEIALDVEWAHAIAPKATILLVETPSNSLSDLVNGAVVAVRNGASVVSMSWTASEFSSESSMDKNFVSNG
ncbi:MAG: hypothetical protein WCC21_07400, partial [Candidatus Acidiferrales bacterium]